MSIRFLSAEGDGRTAGVGGVAALLKSKDGKEEINPVPGSFFLLLLSLL